MFVLHHRGFLIYPIHPHMPSPAQISIENVETVFPDSATVHHTWELTVPLADMTRSIVDETKSEVKQIWNTKLNVHGDKCSSMNPIVKASRGLTCSILAEWIFLRSDPRQGV